jgi:hypothetical protein
VAIKLSTPHGDRCHPAVVLQVIGAGFGRTGTLSTRAALERLTGGRCYHMFEALSHPEHLGAWLAADEGRPEELSEVLADYSCTVDWPGCSLWAELMELFPESKVLLSVRPAERWWASYEQTVHQLMLRDLPDPESVPADFYLLSLFGSRLTKRSFPAGYADLGREDFIAAYERHNAEVRAGVPDGRLLEFDVSQGWEPLCEFLELPVPDEPFPRLNDTAGFRALFGLDLEEAEVRKRHQSVTRDSLQEQFGSHDSTA